VDRRDDFGTWHDTGGQSDRRGYGAEQGEDTFPVPRQEPRYSSLADLHERRNPVSGAPMSPGRGPRSGEPMPPMPPQERWSEPADAVREPTSMVDSASVRKAVADSDGLYRSKRPAFAVLFGVIGTLGVLLMLRPFLTGAFGLTTKDALAPILGMIAFPLLSLGLYGLFTGAAAAVHFQGPRVWLKTPLVYLPIALALLIAAGTAA
jgi:hypothetical protein